MGNPTTPVLSVVPEPPKYNVYDLVSLAFRLARKAVSHENYTFFSVLKWGVHSIQQYI